MNPKYPIYVISKGRYKSCLTARELNLMKVPFYLVVEPKELDLYAGVAENILVTPENFSENGTGSTPVRNFVWQHSIDHGFMKHWILDDNIEGFHRLNRNEKPKVDSGTIFKCAEDFSDRYRNVAISGFNYYSFCKKTDKVPPFYLNTRIYSCMLINNKIPYMWEGRYNEDTDICIRALKDGWCTILFNAFLAGKVTTMRMKGGNTDTIYNTGDNRREFADSLQRKHPDIVKTVFKFGRWHHSVNYSQFKKNVLIKIDDSVIYPEIDNYGMVLLKI